MTSRPFLLAAVLIGLAVPAAAQQRAVAVTFDDLPYQASEAELCDPVRAMALTEDFVAMLRPLDTRATVFVNEGKVCEAHRAVLLPALLGVWLDAGELELVRDTRKSGISRFVDDLFGTGR